MLHGFGALTFAQKLVQFFGGDRVSGFGPSCLFLQNVAEQSYWLVAGRKLQTDQTGMGLTDFLFKSRASPDSNF